MSSNRSARQKLERLYGKICMVEKAGIRYIPVEERRKIKGYSRKYDDMITFHHLKERANGGEATVENGALVKGYNHRWINSLTDKEREEVNQRIIEFKMATMEIVDGQLQITDSISIELADEGEYDTIPVYDNTPSDMENRRRFNRAREKRDFQKQVEEYYQEEDENEI